jgi:hypothetical protein
VTAVVAGALLGAVAGALRLGRCVFCACAGASKAKLQADTSSTRNKAGKAEQDKDGPCMPGASDTSLGRTADKNGRCEVFIN